MINHHPYTIMNFLLMFLFVMYDFFINKLFLHVYNDKYTRVNVAQFSLLFICICYYYTLRFVFAHMNEKYSLPLRLIKISLTFSPPPIIKFMEFYQVTRLQLHISNNTS